MSLPSSWVDHLFARLTVRYGAAFLRQYADLNVDVVKADWAEVLERFDGKALSYGLTYLPTDKPPSALQFREICRRSPPTAVPALDAPGTHADPDRVRELIAGLKAGSTAVERPADRVRATILRIAESRGGVLSRVQRQQLQAIERMVA